jgi:hypothetical protein
MRAMFHAGTIAKATGMPNAVNNWNWSAGFYPGSRPGEVKTGSAETFEAARVAFEKAWQHFAATRTEADYQAWATTATGPPPSMPPATAASPCPCDEGLIRVIEDLSRPLTKILVARAQLVTALDLFVRDKDPISIQCLACGGGEVMQGLAEAHGEEPLALHILKTQPRLDRWAVRRIRNQYWNAFKHVSDRDGLAREDEELLERFDDTNNDAALFVGWWDYMTLVKRLPIAAQVFQIWWYALYEEKLSPDEDLHAIRSAFPDIIQQPRAEQKRRLRRSVEKYRNNRELLADPATEP